MGDFTGKRILFIITKSNWGGAQRYVYVLATRLARAGADVAVALGGTGEPGAGTGALAEHLRAQSIRTIVLKSLARDVSVWHEWSAFLELLRVIKQEKPDVLHLNSSKAGGIGALAGRILRVRLIVFTVHGWAHREARSLLTRLLIRFASWVTIAASHVVIAVSRRDFWDAPVLLSHKKIHVINNGVDAQAPLISRKEARERLAALTPVPDGVPLILSMGELTRNKAYDVLIDALGRVRLPFFCAIIGEGEERPVLERLIAEHSLAERLALVGFIRNASDILPAGDLLVLPSRKEGLPFTLLEAGLAGLPVIATNTGGIPEICRADQDAGLLVSVGDAEALARAIESLLRDPLAREKIGGKLRDRVREHFSEERMIRETVALYR